MQQQEVERRSVRSGAKAVSLRLTEALRDLAGRSESHEEDKRIHTLAKAFYETLCSSGRFSRMSVFETKDELQRPRFVVYLKKNGSSGETSQNSRGAGIGEPFSELSLALRPNIFLDLYYDYSEDDGDTLERCEKDIKLRYGANGHDAEAGFLWDEHLPKSM